MWIFLYVSMILFILWIIARLLIWQCARKLKRKFNLDVTVKSIGLFSIKEVTIRNQFQTIEVEKMSFHFKLLNRNNARLIVLEFGEIRFRSEIAKSSASNLASSDAFAEQQSTTLDKEKFYDTLICLVLFFFKHMSLNIEMLNIMVLHAFVPDSLLHVNIQGISLASDMASERYIVGKSDSGIAPCLSLKSVEGKILKSPKEAAEVTSCIVELSSSLEIVVVVNTLKPCLNLNLVNIDFNKLQIEIHEGALVPGILLPSIKLESISKKSESKLNGVSLDLIQTHLTGIIACLPSSLTLHVQSFGLAFFGDETMGETTRGAHVCCRKILLSQAKDATTMVPVVVESLERKEFKVPHGFIRLTFEDVTMTDYYKHKVAYMGKTVLETKLTANGILSNSIDLTSWHVDYIHNESVEFWNIIFNKLKDAERQRCIFQETLYQFSPQGASISDSFSKRRKRISSAPESISHPDILQGTEETDLESFVDDQPGSSFSVARVLKTIQINVIFECTVYDASFNVLMIPVNSALDIQNLPSFAMGLDSFTGNVDQSPNSKDFNFMSKMDHFWCTVSRDRDTFLHNQNQPQDHSSNSQHGVHLWGRVLNVENLDLYGSACIKAPTTPKQLQEISFLIDAKVSGVQLEISECAAEAIASFLVTILPESSENNLFNRPTYKRQMTTPEFLHSSSTQQQTKKLWSLACLEIEMSKVNGFILSEDKSSYADCLVARLDLLKAEITGNDDLPNSDDVICTTRSIAVSGFAVSTVHNPAFSAFAFYDTGISGNRTPSSQLPRGLRNQQIKAPQYKCVQASEMQPNNLCFDNLKIIYSTNYNSDDSSSCNDLPQNPNDQVRRQLLISVTSESNISLRWSPAFHALVHYGLNDFVSHLRPFIKRVDGGTQFGNSVPILKMNRKLSNRGDNSLLLSSGFTTVKVKMHGDGFNLENDKSLRPIEVDVNVSSIKLNFNLTDKQDITLRSSPIRCVYSNYQTCISISEFEVVMDCNPIFIFADTIIKLAPSLDKCDRDRKLFSELQTKTNRGWSFSFSTVTCNFPHKYDFASSFDCCITTFKWVKSLYRKKSHPFRSNCLPPDLYISVEKFVFEIADWEFECHLHDNHELMKDEWTESEKRRQVLDQRMAALRKERGEMLPAKRVEELYCRLEEESTKIYLTRCRDLYGFYCPPVFTMPHHQASHSIPKYYGPDCPEGQYRSDKLFSWTLQNFTAAVLADETLHGMKNAIRTIRSIDKEAPFPFKNDQDGDDCDFVTMWCRVISLHASNHQVRLRNYPQCLMDYSDWTIRGKFCGAEQAGSHISKRTEYVQLPSPWGRVQVLRNMPTLKFYHELTSEVKAFNMAWGPCWDPAWAQVNLAFNLITKPTIDPSPPLPWWDKSRMLFHGKLEMSMTKVELLHLASLDPYNTTEHMHWDWKNLYMLWTSGYFLFQGDLDIHIRNASKYDDIRFLHLPHLKMSCNFDWICLNSANSHDHHSATPCARDKIEASALSEHDSYRYFRSRNIDLSIDFDTRCNTPDNSTKSEDYLNSPDKEDKPEVLLYSNTLRWLGNFWYAINAVTRPISKGRLFNNVFRPKIKLSRHYRNVKLSFKFPELKACYWASFVEQLGIEMLCGAGELGSHFHLLIVPQKGKILRRSLAQWSVVSLTCELSNTKIYLLKKQGTESILQSPSTRSSETERNFMLSFSRMSYHRSISDTNRPSSPMEKMEIKRSDSLLSQSSMSDYDDVKLRKNLQKTPSSPTKKPQNSQTLVVHDLKAMWTIDNRDVVYGLYEGYNKAAVLRRNLNTKILSKLRIGANRDNVDSYSTQNRKQQPTNLDADPVMPSTNYQRTMDLNEMLKQLFSEPGEKLIVGAEENSSEKPVLKGVAASSNDDVVNENWVIKFVNCQAMLKGPKTQGYIILTASQAKFSNKDYKVKWREGQLTTKSAWIGSLSGTQLFATVERNVTSSGQDGENVPWLSVSDIAPRGPSPGMLDITDLMGGGQAIGGVVGGGVSAGSFQLQRIVSRCVCEMYYVGYEALVDSEQSDYGHILPDTPFSPDEEKLQIPKVHFDIKDPMKDEKSSNVLTILQTELEICTNTSQFTMILDIVENLLLYVEPVMKEHWERVERMRYKLRLTSADDALKHRDTLAAMQSRIRTLLTNMRQLERQWFIANQAPGDDPKNKQLKEELEQRLAVDKETLNSHSEELGIIIRCFKELFLDQKTRNSSLRVESLLQGEADEEEASVARTTEVSLGRVKWHLTDEDGQLYLAHFEMKEFQYEKVNRSDDSVSHCFEVAWLCLQNLLPNSIYRDVIKPRYQAGLRNFGVSGAGGQSLTLRVLCRVRPPVGGISVKDHVEVNAAPLSIQLTYHFFKRMMGFFFPDKGTTSSALDDDDINFPIGPNVKDNKGLTLLGIQTNSPSQEQRGSVSTLPPRPPPPTFSTSSNHRRNKSLAKRDRAVPDAVDDVDKMKERAAKNNSFLYIKITQVSLCVSYKGEKEKNYRDIHEFDVMIPMLEYHSVTWTWHDFAMAVKRDCRKHLLSQFIKKKFHLVDRVQSQAQRTGESDESEAPEAAESNKIKLLFGNTLQRNESTKKSLLSRKKK